MAPLLYNRAARELAQLAPLSRLIGLELIALCAVIAFVAGLYSTAVMVGGLVHG